MSAMGASGGRRRWVSRTTALIVGGFVVVTLALSVAAAAPGRPRVIPLPDGFQPEGVATTQDGDRFFAGSLADGAIYKGSLRTGEGEILVDGAAGRVAVGLKVRRGLIWVAGGPTGQAYVFDAHSGEEVATARLTDEVTFINDVVVTHQAAWFTDSFQQQLYRVPIGRDGGVGKPTTLPLTGDVSFVPDEFNVNGIESAHRAGKLIVVQSNTGQLFEVDSHSGETTAIDLGGESVPAGDGILLDGQSRLWVVQNANVVTQVELDSDLESGEVVGRTTHRSFDVPTTVAESGGYLAVANARFDTVTDPSSAEYWVTQIRKPSRN